MQNIVKTGKASASKRQRAQILLAADASKEGGELRDAVLDVSIATIERTRCALCEHGLQIVVHGWPPEGASRWTLKLPGDHLVGLGLVSSVSNPTIGRALKKATSNRGR